MKERNGHWLIVVRRGNTTAFFPCAWITSRDAKQTKFYSVNGIETVLSEHVVAAIPHLTFSERSKLSRQEREAISEQLMSDVLDLLETSRVSPRLG